MNAERFLFQDMTPAERIQALRDNANSIADKSYNKNFTEAEILVFKDRLAESSIKKRELDQKIKDLKAEYAAKTKPYKADIAGLIGNIRDKFERVEEQCYQFNDQELGDALFYNSEGELIEQRKLYQEERQMSFNSGINSMSVAQ